MIVTDMYATLLVITIVTLIELIITKFSLWFIIALIARLMFAARFVGAMFKQKHMCTLEGVAIACNLVWNMVMNKGHVNWVRILIFVICAALCIITELYDNSKYVYTTEDDEEV